MLLCPGFARDRASTRCMKRIVSRTQKAAKSFSILTRKALDRVCGSRTGHLKNNGHSGGRDRRWRSHLAFAGHTAGASGTTAPVRLHVIPELRVPWRFYHDERVF